VNQPGPPSQPGRPETFDPPPQQPETAAPAGGAA
jgi:hypothetical protein